MYFLTTLEARSPRSISAELVSSEPLSLLKTKEDAGGRSLGLQRGRRLTHMEEENQELSN